MNGCEEVTMRALVTATVCAWALWACEGPTRGSLEQARLTVDPEVELRLERGQSVDVLVESDSVPAFEAAAAESGGLVEVVETYDQVPFVHLRLEALDALEVLRQAAVPAHVHANTLYRYRLEESLSHIGQPIAAEAGFVGAGVNVAVLDTGVDFEREAFGACPEAGALGCKVVYAADFAPEDGQADDPTHPHGTNVAGIVLGVAPGAGIISLDVFDGPYAKSSDIIAALDWLIAHRDDLNVAAVNLSLGAGLSESPCGNNPIGTALAAARDAGIANAVSSGNDGDPARISAPACHPAAFSVGAVYDRPYSKITWSECSDQDVEPDDVTCFSNAAPFLDMVAPGAVITAAGLSMGGTSMAAPHVAGALAVLRASDPGAGVDELEGWLREQGAPVEDSRTGQSFPRLELAALEDTPPMECEVLLPSAVSLEAGSAGVVQGEVVIRSVGCELGGAAAPDAIPWATFDADLVSPYETRLVISAAPNPLSVERRARLVAHGHDFILVQAPNPQSPSGALTINGGAASTAEPLVELSVDVPAGVPVTEMCLSEAPEGCDDLAPSWRQVAPTLTWPLSDHPGDKTLYLWLRDVFGNVSPSPATATIALLPTPQAFTAIGYGDVVSLTWCGVSAESYVLTVRTGQAPAHCSDGAVLYSGSGTSFLHHGVDAGADLYYRLCASAGGSSWSLVTTPIPAG